ncbi:hypothetical protein ACFL6U_06345 [Planctomycetota bacterium]
MSFVFECPKCESVLRAEEETVGKLGECPQCKEVVKVPAPLPGQKTSSTQKDENLKA